MICIRRKRSLKQPDPSPSFKPFDAVNNMVAFEDIRRQIRRWHRFHPLGAVEESEKQEWHDLQKEEQRLIRKINGNVEYPHKPPDDEFDPFEGENWRN